MQHAAQPCLLVPFPVDKSLRYGSWVAAVCTPPDFGLSDYVSDCLKPFLMLKNTGHSLKLWFLIQPCDFNKLGHFQPQSLSETRGPGLNLEVN